jgi:hypothetical protein
MKISYLIDLAKGNLETNIVGLNEGDIVSATFGEIKINLGSRKNAEIDSLLETEFKEGKDTGREEGRAELLAEIKTKISLLLEQIS